MKKIDKSYATIRIVLVDGGMGGANNDYHKELLPQKSTAIVSTSNMLGTSIARVLYKNEKR